MQSMAPIRYGTFTFVRRALTLKLDLVSEVVHEIRTLPNWRTTESLSESATSCHPSKKTGLGYGRLEEMLSLYDKSDHL